MQNALLALQLNFVLYISLFLWCSGEKVCHCRLQTGAEMIKKSKWEKVRGGSHHRCVTTQ